MSKINAIAWKCVKCGSYERRDKLLPDRCVYCSGSVKLPVKMTVVVEAGERADLIECMHRMEHELCQNNCSDTGTIGLDIGGRGIISWSIIEDGGRDGSKKE